MMYPYMTLPDETEIVHSEILLIDGKEQVRVYMEKPVHMGFKTATCYLPDYRWENISGFTDEEMSNLNDIVTTSAHLIMRFAKEGGVDVNASNF